MFNLKVEDRLISPYNLHDAAITKIYTKDDSLILDVNNIWLYKDGKELELSCSGTIEFTKTNINDCSIMVFDKSLQYDYKNKNQTNVLSFTGKYLSIDEYILEYSNCKFEIIIQTYNGYDTIFQGYTRDKDYNPIFTMLNIYNIGDIIFDIKEN